MWVLFGDNFVSSFTLFTAGGWNSNELSVQAGVEVEDECDDSKGSRWMCWSWACAPNNAGNNVRRGIPWQIWQVATDQLVQDGMGSSLAIVIKYGCTFICFGFELKDSCWIHIRLDSCRGELWAQRSGHRVPPQAKILPLGYLHFEGAKCSLTEERRLILKVLWAPSSYYFLMSVAEGALSEVHLYLSFLFWNVVLEPTIVPP